MNVILIIHTKNFEKIYMLVITRKKDQAVVLVLPNGEKIIVRLNQSKGAQTTLGITAPENIIILRDELDQL